MLAGDSLDASPVTPEAAKLPRKSTVTPPSRNVKAACPASAQCNLLARFDEAGTDTCVRAQAAATDNQAAKDNPTSHAVANAIAPPQDPATVTTDKEPTSRGKRQKTS